MLRFVSAPPHRFGFAPPYLLGSLVTPSSICSGLVDGGSHPCGDSPNRIRLSQEKRLAEISGLTGFFYQKDTCSASATITMYTGDGD